MTWSADSRDSSAARWLTLNWRLPGVRDENHDIRKGPYLLVGTASWAAR